MHTELIDISTFAKTDLRVGKVLSCARVDGADKLLKFEVDLGEKKVPIVSGIAAFYHPDDLVGRTVLVVANLKPVTLRGEPSEGMLLSADVGDRLVLLTLPDDLPAGASVH